MLRRPRHLRPMHYGPGYAWPCNGNAIKPNGVCVSSWRHANYCFRPCGPLVFRCWAGGRVYFPAKFSFWIGNGSHATAWVPLRKLGIAQLVLPRDISFFFGPSPCPPSLDIVLCVPHTAYPPQCIPDATHMRTTRFRWLAYSKATLRCAKLRYASSSPRAVSR